MERQDRSVTGIVTGEGVEAKYKDQLDALRTTHKRIRFWELEGHGLYVIRKPTRLEHQRWQREINLDGFDQSVARENYTRACTVFPEAQDAITAVHDDWAMFTVQCWIALQQLGGGVVEELKKA